MTSDTRRFKSTEELAFANIGGEMPQSLPQDRYATVEGEQRKLLQRQIDQAMIGAIADTRRPNPVNGNGSPPTVRRRRRGTRRWRSGHRMARPWPFASGGNPSCASGDGGLAHQHLPHSPGNSAWRGPKPKKEE